MKFFCPNCGAKYRIDPANLPEKGVHLRCKKCTNRFFVGPQAGSDNLPEQSKKPDAAAGQPGDTGQQNTPDPAIEAPAVDDNPLPEMEQVDQYVASGNPEAAADLLIKLITQQARKKDFTSAESLRDKLYEVAPMALGEIVKANEIIEEEKGRSIDAGHLKLWAGLYDTLESDEASELYYAMQPVSVDGGKPVFEKGSLDSNLYFLQQGRVHMVHWDNTRDQEVVLKEIAPGGFFNQDAFFSFTVTTSTMIAAQNTQLTYLEKACLDKWKEKFPGIEPKLGSYCRQSENMYELAQKAGIEMRAYPRFLTSLAAMIQYLDTSGGPQSKPFKVTLFDISASGISFELKLNRKEDAAQLLGQRLEMHTNYTIGSKEQAVRQTGRVIAAHIQPFGLSAIHINFDELLPEETMKDIQHISSQSEDAN